jgi:hypothetical protein
MRQSQQLVIIIIIELKEAAAASTGGGHTDPDATCRESAESFLVMSVEMGPRDPCPRGSGTLRYCNPDSRCALFQRRLRHEYLRLISDN